MLTWDHSDGTAQSERAMEGQWFVGQIVRYDRPPGWAAFLVGNRVPGGPWAQPADARAALEEAWAERPPRPRRGGRGFTGRLAG